jgi:L-asparagine transporter-like permease
MENNRSELKLHTELREKARSNVNFKMHRTIFFLANILIWLVSALLYYAFSLTWLWAIFPTAIWLIILIFHYLWVFRWNKDRVEKEYQKLLKEFEKKEAGVQNPLESPRSEKENQNTL